MRLGEDIDADVNRQVHALASRLRATRPEGVVDIVPAYASIAVLFEPGMHAAALRRQTRAWLQGALAQPVTSGTAQSREPVEIAVRYGGDEGPDLPELAAHAGLSVDETVRRHCAAEYTVAMLGFAPGFPYLLGLDPALAMPRLDAPRAQVPAGSVGIAELQCGIYPQPSPGGWRLVGRTDARLFAPGEKPPTLLSPGDRVRFRAS